MRLDTLRTSDGTAAAVAAGDLVEVEPTGVGVLTTPIRIEESEAGAPVPARAGGSA